MDERIVSSGMKLAAHVARPPGRPSGPPPAVVLCHGYPSATDAGVTTPELADRIATEMGWVALAFAFRGCGDSEGQFSLAGWLDDIGAAVSHVQRELRPLGIWLAGFGTRGSRAWRPWAPRVTSTTGPATLAGCSSTAATWG
jgi:uncharacterized protein